MEDRLGPRPVGRPHGRAGQWDTYRLVVPEYQAHNATVFALAAWGVANLPELLTRENVERRDDTGGGDAATIVEGMLGVELAGVSVKSVGDDGPAKAAGIAAGDLIVRAFGEPVQGAVDLARLLRENRREREIPLRVKRGEEEIDVQVERRRRR
jgi:S1-C subfamily serine protease